ncbi:MAG TPA: hypothetical protein VF868_11285 [Bacteroidia bacterium]|jgi:hypothetical protein
MKAAALALLFIPIASIAQTGKPVAKSSSTDCPTFVNKPQVSKAAYFESLRHTKKAAKPAAENKKPEPAYVPSFASTSDKVLEKPASPPAKPVEEKKPVIAEKQKPAAAPVEKKVTAEDGPEEKVQIAEKKAPKKKKALNTSGRVRTPRRSAEKCPQF